MPRRPRLFFLLNRAQRALKTRVEREAQAELGLTSLELAALWALSPEQGLGVQALARVLHVDHAVVSRLSKQLVRKGVVERVSDPDDGRRTVLQRTEAGAESAARGRILLKAANARIAEGFSDDEIATVGRFLEHLIDVAGASEPLAPTSAKPPGGRRG